jgi:hypothetical protein
MKSLSASSRQEQQNPLLRLPARRVVAFPRHHGQIVLVRLERDLVVGAFRVPVGKDDLHRNPPHPRRDPRETSQGIVPVALA